MKNVIKVDPIQELHIYYIIFSYTRFNVIVLNCNTNLQTFCKYFFYDLKSLPTKLH